jgi:hypothetical protein
MFEIIGGGVDGQLGRDMSTSRSLKKGGYVLENGLWRVDSAMYMPFGRTLYSEQNGFGPAFLQRTLRHNTT